MRRLTLLLCFLYHAASNSALAQTILGMQEVTLDQEREFLGLRDTVVYAPVDLMIEERRTLLHLGARNAAGDCEFQETYTSLPEEWKDGYSSVTVEVGYNPALCQRLLYSGWITKQQSLPKPSDEPLRQDQKMLLPGPQGQQSDSIFDASPLPVPPEYGGTDPNGYTKPLLRAASSTSYTAKAHARWTDGYHPLMQALDAELDVNYVDTETNFQKNFCSGIALVVSTSFWSRWYTGWYLASGSWDRGYAYTHYYDSGGTYLYSTGNAHNLMYAVFSNFVFPGCQVAGVSTNYQPNGMRIDSQSGAVTWQQTITKSGQMIGCGNYLRLYTTRTIET